MRTIPRSALVAAALLWAYPALAALRIGVVAPLSGPSLALGNQVAAGARAAIALAGADRIEGEFVDDACTAAGGAAAAERLVAAKVQVVVGFLCAESIAAAMPVLASAGIPVIAVGVRADSLTDGRKRTGWVVARLAPRADGEREAAGRLLADLWQTTLFAIVDDGTVYGRDLGESVREATEGAGLKPVFTDTLQPGNENQIALAGRLARAGASRIFVGGERSDIAVLARDAAAQAPGTVLVGGEALRDEPGPVALTTGTLMVGLPEAADNAAPDAIAAIRAQGSQPEGYALPAFAAVEIAEKAISANPPQAKSPFDGRTFGTAIGPVGFDGKGDLAQSPYRLFQWDGRHFVPLETQ